MEQIEGLEKVLTELKKRGYNICLYTGWSEKNVPDRILSLIDYLKAGSFVKQLHKGDLQYYGSSNQKMFQVSCGKIVREVA